MSRWNTALLVVAAITAAVFAAIFIPLQRGGTLPSGSPLFHFDPDDVRYIKITNGEKIFELKKSVDGWMIGPDPEDRASVSAVKQLMEAAQGTPVLDRIARSEISDRDRLSQYGLRKSSVQLDFKGDRSPPLLIGKDAADEKLVYVRFEDSWDVYLIPDHLVRMVLSPAQDYRDRMPLRLRPDRVDRLIIRRPAGEIELSRGAAGWMIVKPLSARASTPAVEAFLEKIFRTRIEEFEVAGDSSAFGLAEPVAEIRAFGEGDSVPEMIRVGAGVPEGGCYARLLPRDVTVRMPTSLMDLLSVDPTSFRDPSLARINPDLVDMIRISSPTTNFDIRRDGEGWKIGDKQASHLAVQRMLDAFAQAKPVRYEPATAEVLAKTGLAKPVCTVGFYSILSENTPEASAGEHRIAEFRFGSNEGNLPVHTSGTPEVAFTENSLVLEAIPTTPEAWLLP